MMCACTAAVLCSDFGSVSAQAPLDPAKVRAAYLYHFMRFIEWPTPAKPGINESYNICIPDNGAEFNALRAITTKTVNDRPVSIRHTDKTDSLKTCHILYLTGLKPVQAKALIDSISGLPILSVGNGDNFLDLGGMIAFESRIGQVTFSVNLTVANRAGLKISANMLDVADRVIK